MNAQKIKWAAQLNGLREVSLLGAVDLDFWQRRLHQEQLSPIAKDGRAQVLIVSADGSFKGLRFQEVSFSVLASSQMTERTLQGTYRIQAFNSRRLFAFFERTLFGTPYNHGGVKISTTAPASVQIRRGGGSQLSLEVRSCAGRAPIRKPANVGEGGWDGPVFCLRAAAAVDSPSCFMPAFTVSRSRFHSTRTATGYLITQVPRRRYSRRSSTRTSHPRSGSFERMPRSPNRKRMTEPTLTRSVG